MPSLWSSIAPPPCGCSVFFDDDEDGVIACIPDVASVEYAARFSAQSTSQRASNNSNDTWDRKIDSTKKKICNHQCFFGDDEDDFITCAPDMAGTECAARRSTKSTSQGMSTDENNERGTKIGGTKKRGPN